MSAAASRIGAVVIGRNEGERLERCLASLPASLHPVVYVDSGSSDGSVALARSRGAAVVELDPATPFTAARARNAGLRRLHELAPGAALAQLVDGDCALAPGWLSAAEAALDAEPRTAIVCGRRRERYPEASLYNRLCDLEWDTPVGVALDCGGDALVRVAALADVGGYRDGMIAGEEPELCHRLRAAGWTIRRLEAEMTLHDAAIHRFGQWWTRQVRAGHAYAECFALHGRSAERFRARELASIAIWGGVLPLAALAGAIFTRWSLVVGIALYAVLFARVRAHRLAHGDAPPFATRYAAFCVLGKFAQLRGALGYALARVRGRGSRLIEYKGGPAAADAARGPAPGGR